MCQQCLITIARMSCLKDNQWEYFYGTQVGCNGMEDSIETKCIQLVKPLIYCQGCP